jgi:hypothetical protein
MLASASRKWSLAGGEAAVTQAMVIVIANENAAGREPGGVVVWRGVA